MRINVHVHIFNLDSVKTSWALGILRKRMEHDISPAELGRLVGDVAAAIVDELPNLNETQLLRTVLDQLGVDAADLPGPLEDILLRQLRRVVDRLIDRFRRGRPETDHRESDLHDILETLRILALPTIGDVTDWLMRQLGPEDAVVPLMHDLTDGDADVRGKTRFGGQPGEELCRAEPNRPLFLRQLCDTSEVILRYPGRILPFVFVHPARPDHFEIMKRALEQHGFVGVKLYPSLGYEVDTAEMRRVYAYCEEHGVPLLMHCNKGGFIGAIDENGIPSSVNADPAHWEPILADFPRLKICFAHFGGSSAMGLPPGPSEPDMPVLDEKGERRWGKPILQLIQRFEGAYADVAFHRTPMDDDETAENYFRRLGRFLEDPDYQRSILFGTDFWLMRPRLREANHWRFFEEHLAAETYGRLALENPSRFLGLPGSGEANDALDAHVDFVVRNEAKLEARPIPWLLDAIEERHGADVRRRIEERTEALLPARRLLGTNWRSLLERAVAAVDLTRDFDETLDAEIDGLKTDFLGFPIAFQAGGSLRVQVFNRSDQTDPDAVLLRPAPEDGRFSQLERRRLEGLQGTPLLFDDDKAWLKYRLEAHLGAEAEAATGLASLEASAEKKFIFSDYRVHPERREPLVEAIRADLGRPRFALSRDDVLALGVGDAVAFETRGKLAAGISLSWQDVLAAGASRLSQLIGAPGAIALRLDAGASISGQVEVTDDFRVVFARHEGGWFRVAVRKIEASDKAFKVAFQAGLQLDNPEALSKALGQLIGMRLGESFAKIHQLLAKEAAESQEEKDLLARLESRLAVAGLERVRDALASLSGELMEAIEEVLRERLEVGFTYQYNRLETGATLLEADVRERVLEELHPQLTDGDLTGLLARCRQGDEDEVELIQYLRFEEVVRRQAWGFHLGPVGGTDIREMTFRRQVDVEGAQKLSFAGQRAYKGKWLEGETWRWEVDFNAQMGSFVAGAIPASAFEYGLGFLFRWGRELSVTALGECVDAAVLWGALAPAFDDSALRTRLESEKVLGQDAGARLQLVFGHDALGQLLPAGSATSFDNDLTALAGSLAAAMPCWRAQTHTSPQDRQVYADLWEDFLREAQKPGFVFRRRATARDWGQRAASRLRRLGLTTAAGYEERGFPSSDRWDLKSLAGNLFLNGSPLEPLLGFHEALRRLGGVWRPLGEEGAAREASEEGHEVIESIFGQLEDFWSQTHYVRAAGAFLLERARRTGVLDQVRASLTIRSVREKEEVLVGVPNT